MHLAPLVAAAVPGLMRLDLARLQRLLEPHRLTPAAGTGAEVTDLVAGVGRRLDRLVRWGKPLVRPGCLTRGVTGYYLLRRAGLDVSLCFGVGVGGDASAIGHCWLLVEGKPMLESDNPCSSYIEVARMSAHGVTAAPPSP